VHDAEYYYRPHTTVAKYLGFEFNDIGFSTGKHHRLVRKLCATQLLSHESLNKYEDIQNEARATMINTVWKSASHGNVIEVRDLVLDFTTNVLCRMLMSRTHLDITNIGLGFKQETFKSLVQEIMEVVGKLDTSMFIPWMRWLDLEGRSIKLKELNRRLVKYFKGVIEEHEKSLESDDRAHESNDILDVLLSLEGDDMLSDEAIMGILLDMVVGGTSPSSSSVEWALAELVCNPVILDKVQSELDQIVGRDCILKETDLPRLPYFQAVVKETLRLHPAIPLSLPHMNIVPFQLANYELPEMTSVIVNYEAIGRDSTVWQDPLEFKPERFLNVEISTHIKALEVLPFGYGRRACPGANLGLSLVQLALASLVQGFDWTPCAGQIPHDIDLIESSDFICFKAHKLQLLGTPRLAASVYQS
jgi:cytochrome P450